MKNKIKRLVCCILLACVLVLAGFLGVCSGMTRRVDGIRQNSRIRIEDVTVTNGNIFYTLVNDTPFRLKGYGEGASIQQKIGGVWTRPIVLASDEGVYKGDGMLRTASIGGFSRLYRGGGISSLLTPGEYRLIYGKVSYKSGSDGSVTPVYDDKQIYAVAEFTLSAQDISDVAHGESFVMDGVLQYTDVYATTASRSAYSCTIHNGTTARMELDIAHARFERYDAAAQAFVDTGLQVLRRYQDSIERKFIRAGSEDAIRLCDRYADEDPLPDGYYRVLVPYYLYGDEQTYYAVGYLLLDSTKPPLSEGGS